jgi:hypothetical protein
VGKWVYLLSCPRKEGKEEEEEEPQAPEMEWVGVIFFWCQE